MSRDDHTVTFITCLTGSTVADLSTFAAFGAAFGVAFGAAFCTTLGVPELRMELALAIHSAPDLVAGFSVLGFAGAALALLSCEVSSGGSVLMSSLTTVTVTPVCGSCCCCCLPGLTGGETLSTTAIGDTAAAEGDRATGDRAVAGCFDATADLEATGDRVTSGFEAAGVFAAAGDFVAGVFETADFECDFGVAKQININNKWYNSQEENENIINLYLHLCVFDNASQDLSKSQ